MEEHTLNCTCRTVNSYAYAMREFRKQGNYTAQFGHKKLFAITTSAAVAQYKDELNKS